MPFPDPAYFNFGNTGTLGEPEALVSYVVIDGELIFTLTEAGAGFEGLFDVKLMLQGRAEKEGENISGGNDGSITLNVTPAPEPPIGENTDMPFPDVSKPLFKNGRQQGGDNVLTWSALVNYLNYDKLFTLGNTTQKIADVQEMMLVDHLTPGTTFVPDSLMVSIPTYISTTTNKFGDRQIGGGVDAEGNRQTLTFGDIEFHSSRHKTFALLEQGEMSYDEFYSYAQTYPTNNNGEQAYGVYTHANGLQTVLVAFGNVPGDTYKYSDLRKDFGPPYGVLDIFQCIDLDDSLTTAQKEYMKKIYGPDGPSGGAITGYNIGFAVDVAVPEYGTGTYHNEMTLESKDGIEEETEADAEFIDNSSGINAYGMKMTKKIAGTGAVTPAQSFAFEICAEDGTPVAYGRTETDISQKGEAVAVLFYKDAAYQERILTYNDWKSILVDGSSYFIFEVGAEAYVSEFVKEHTGEVTNEFQYHANVQQVWSFIATNTAKRDIKVTKAWEDSENQDGKRPNSIQVQLKADGVDTGTAVTLNDGNNWTHTWTDLEPKTNGVDIVYTVEEVNSQGMIDLGYSIVVDDSNPDDITITNSYTPETVDISGTKTWDDANNQDGKRPASITVNLLADNVKVQSVTVTEDDGWAYSFTGLPKYKDGSLINYTISEETVPGYSTIINGNNITNSYTPGKTSVGVAKVWDDANNQDGKRPNSIQVQLLANGNAKGTAVTLSESNGWSYIWTDLDEMSAGQKITYTVEEVTVPTGYTSSAQVAGNTVTITNSYTPETVDISGGKTWDDANNQDGKRPASITVNLLADNVKVDSKTVTEDDGWAYSFTGLPKYKDGQLITYTVSEDAIPEYTTTINGYDITNSYTPGKTSVSVAKVWNDAGNQDGKRPNSIEVQLLADGNAIGGTVTLSEGNGWRYTWVDLDEMAAGQQITYSVQEVSVPAGYTSAITEAAGNITITNSYTPETVDISGTKTWNDANNQDGKRPNSITVNLLANNVKVQSKVVTEADGWGYSFTGLDKYKDAQLITYTVSEESVPEYSVEINGYDIVNSYTPGKTSISVAKVWNDAENQDGKRPESIKVQLLADGNAKGAAVELNDANNWSHTWDDLDEMAAGQVIVYTVEEVIVPDGYLSSADKAGGNVTITNSYTPEVIDISGLKTWDDANNQDGKRPESITVNLLANGTQIQSKIVTEADGWAYSFVSVPKYEAGNEIVYTVTEDTVQDYTTTINGYDITNTYTPGKTSVTVTKSWHDDNDQDKMRPQNISIQLLADGVEVGTPVKLSDSNNWTTTWTDLDEKATGKNIDYTVVEVDIPNGYSITMQDENKGNIIITNAHTPAIPENPPASTPSTPKTGDNSPIIFLTSMMAMSALGITGIGLYMGKKRKSTSK